MKAVVITGVSSGIGYDAACRLAERGYRVFGSVRRAADAEPLQAALGERYTPLLFDVTDETAVQAAAAEVTAALSETGLAALINNAGISQPAPLKYVSLAEFRQHLAINVTGVLAVTQAFLPLLGADRASPYPPGRIINIGSLSGRLTYPFMGAYAASKHALEALSDALRRELLLYGVDVVLIEPGTVNTPFFDKFRRLVDRFQETDYGEILGPYAAAVAEREATALPVAAVTAVIIEALESGRPKTRYPIPRKRFSSWLIPKWLPDRLFDKLIARKMGMKN